MQKVRPALHISIVNPLAAGYFCFINHKNNMIMNKKLQTALGMILLVSSAIGQTTDPDLNKVNEEKAIPRTYFTPIIKVGSSNLNYGSSNSSVADYKKDVAGIQAG